MFDIDLEREREREKEKERRKEREIVNVRGKRESVCMFQRNSE